MNELLWALQALLAGMMLTVGILKAASGREESLGEPKSGWVATVSGPTLSTIGVLEVGAAVGLVLPWALGIARVITPLAAVGVTALAIGAMFTQRRRIEMHAITMNVVITFVAAVVAVGRFGDL